MRYDINSFHRPEGTYRIEDISRTKYISQIPAGIYIVEKKQISGEICFFLEVPPRFELGNNSFADCGLTTWQWHRILIYQKTLFLQASFVNLWSGIRDSNSRRSPWQGDALPLSHSRIYMVPPGGIEPPTQGFSVPCSTD